MKWWHLLISVIVSIAIGFVIGTISYRNEPIYRDIVKTDTLIVEKEITQIKPIYKHIYHTDTMRVVVDSIVRDTIFLPREVRVYEDSLYRAVVSGYEPSLDTISVFPKDRIIYKSRVEYVPKKQKWGVGIQVGYGLGVNKGFVGTPYIGVGISYNLFTW